VPNLLLAPSLRALHLQDFVLHQILQRERGQAAAAQRALAELDAAQRAAQRVRGELEASRLRLQQTGRLRALRRDELARSEEALRRDAGLRAAAALEVAASGATLAAATASERVAGGPESSSLRRGRLPSPVAGATILARFGPRPGPRPRTELPHAGVDLAAAPGSPVLAVAAGRLVWAGPLGGYGLVAIVDHGQGWHSVYARLSELALEPGAPVSEGQRLGDLGAGLLDEPAHLHFELRERGLAQDPVPWLAQP